MPFRLCCLRLFAGMWLSLVGTGWCQAQPAAPAAAPAPSAGAPLASGPDVLAALQARCAAAVKRAETAVVAISRVDTSRDAAGFRIPNLGRLAGASRLEELLPADADFVPTQYGAGFVIDPAGFILTTYHALGAAPTADQAEYYVWRDHRPLRARLVAADGWYDLAVLQVATAGVEGVTWEPLPWAKSPAFQKGDFVIALGNPQAIARDGAGCATWSILGGTQRRAPPVTDRTAPAPGRETLHHYGTLLQFDAPLHIGYAGGPVVNLGGEVIGIATAYSGQATSPRAAAFAIPVDESLLTVVNSLKEGKVPPYGFLGVGLQPLDPRARREGRHGAVVESVMRGTPASRAEMQIGDRLTHVDGEPLFDDDEVIRAVSRLVAGRQIQIKLARAGDKGDQILEKSVVLTGRGESAVRPNYNSAPRPTWRGMVIDDATAAPRDDLLGVELPDHGGGFIAQVAANSPAAEAELRAGQFIATVGGRPFTSAAEFWQIVNQLAGEPVELELLHSGGPPRRVTIARE